MATPMTASQLLDALRAEGLRVVEHRFWSNHNRGSRGTGWGPINGVIIHHTAGSDDTDTEVRICYDGRSDLPGPLCHGVIAKDGTVYLVGNGRANHAGLGDGDVLRHVIDENYPLPSPNDRDTDGNSRFYGFECINRGDGHDPWPEAQLEAIARASAAICRHYGWSARSVIGHKEWTSWKIDPRGFAMDDMRDRIQHLIDHGADATPPLTQTSHTTKPKPGSHPARYQVTINGLAYGYGAHGAHVTAVGHALVKKGFGRHYTVGPGPRWTDADTENYSDYQQSMGFHGTEPHGDADGVPGKTSLRDLLGYLPGMVVDLSRVRAAAYQDPPKHGTPVSYEGVKIVEDALVAEGLLAARYADGHFGSKTISAYAALQRRYGYRGADADGIPGRASLTRLGEKHHFTVHA